MSTRSLRQLIASARLLPVVIIDDPGRGVALARALQRGGLTAIEVTLRSDAAFTAAEAIIAACPELLVGIGTVTRAGQIARAADIGARFAVSPGFAPALVEVAREHALPYLPGVCTPSEILQAFTLGLDTLKFFPAARAGGVAALTELAAVFPDVAFCPTGGIDESNLAEYLALANVCAAGGSWLAPAAQIRAGAWDEIEACSRRGAAIALPSPSAPTGE